MVDGMLVPYQQRSTRRDFAFAGELDAEWCGYGDLIANSRIDLFRTVHQLSFNQLSFSYYSNNNPVGIHLVSNFQYRNVS